MFFELQGWSVGVFGANYFVFFIFYEREREREEKNGEWNEFGCSVNMATFYDTSKIVNEMVEWQWKELTFLFAVYVFEQVDVWCGASRS